MTESKRKKKKKKKLLKQNKLRAKNKFGLAAYLQFGPSSLLFRYRLGKSFILLDFCFSSLKEGGEFREGGRIQNFYRFLFFIFSRLFFFFFIHGFPFRRAFDFFVASGDLHARTRRQKKFRITSRHLEFFHCITLFSIWPDGQVQDGGHLTIDIVTNRPESNFQSYKYLAVCSLSSIKMIKLDCFNKTE